MTRKGFQEGLQFIEALAEGSHVNPVSTEVPIPGPTGAVAPRPAGMGCLRSHQGPSGRKNRGQTLEVSHVASPAVEEDEDRVSVAGVVRPSFKELEHRTPGE
jgi:hypothetical protein